MSWFDSSGWAKVAKTALSNAQKTIDQALDIKDASSATSSYNRNIDKSVKEKSDTDLFGSFGVSNLLSTASSSLKSKEDSKSKSSKKDKSSDFFSWGEWGKEENSSAIDEIESNNVIASSPKRKNSQDLSPTLSSESEIASIEETNDASDSYENVPLVAENNQDDAKLEDTVEIENANLNEETVPTVQIVLGNEDDIAAEQLDSEPVSGWDADFDFSNSLLTILPTSQENEAEDSKAVNDVPEETVTKEDDDGDCIVDSSDCIENVVCDLAVNEADNDSDHIVEGSDCIGSVVYESMVNDARNGSDHTVESSDCIENDVCEQTVDDSHDDSGHIVESCDFIENDVRLCLENLKDDVVLQEESASVPAASLRDASEGLSHMLASTDEKASEMSGEENEIQTSSDTLVLSEDDPYDSVKISDEIVCQSSISKADDCSEDETLLQNVAEDVDQQSNSSSSSLSSFVKFSGIENDSVKTSSSPPSHSSSDILKIDIGMMSGHTSGDELETTTSSDIEIISSPNGGSSSSTSGRDSRSGALCAFNKDDVCGHKDGDIITGSHKRTASDTSSEGVGHHLPSPHMVKKMSEMAAVIDAREAQLVEMSKNNIQLQQHIEDLKSKMSVGELETSKTMTDMQDKVIILEMELQQSTENNTSLQQQLELTKKQVNQMLRPEEIQGALQEKELQIQELLAEGEKLSKQHLQHSNIIKKLRAKQKQNDETIQKNTEQLLEKSTQLENLKKKLNDQSDNDKMLAETVKQLNTNVQRLENELAQSVSDLEDVNERNKGLKMSLENSSKEMCELQKLNAEKNNAAQEATLSFEMKMKEQLAYALDQAEQMAKTDRNILLSQIEEFQLNMNRAEKKASYREDMLRQEIADLNERLQLSESKNDEIAHNISAATRPLLRQIENLQSAMSAQTQSFEGIEKNLTDRLAEAQRQLAVANSKEKIATEKYMDISSDMSALQSKNSGLLREKTMLNSSVENLRSKLEQADQEKTTFSLQIDSITNELKDEINVLKKAKTESEMEVALYKERYESERKSVLSLQDQLEKHKTSSIIMSESSSGANTPMSMSRLSSVSDNPWLQEDMLDQSLMSLSSNMGNKMSVYDRLRASNSGSSLIENLQSQLKQREGEIMHLQGEMSNMERIRESMSEELVHLTTENDQVQCELEDLKGLKVKFDSMQGKYNALLQMYGEKVEEANELKMDLDDVKQMYRLQIDELLRSNT